MHIKVTYNQALHDGDDDGGGVEPDVVDEDSGRDSGHEPSGSAQRRPQAGDQSVHRRVCMK